MRPPELVPVLTLYTRDDVDGYRLGKLVKAMCDLNGVTVAIELHPQARECQPGGSARWVTTRFRRSETT